MESEYQRYLRQALDELRDIQKRLGVAVLLIEASRRSIDESLQAAKEEPRKKRAVRRH